MQKPFQGNLFLSSSWLILLVLVIWPVSSFSQEPGFQDSFRVFTPDFVNITDSTIKNLSRVHRVPIFFETSAEKNGSAAPPEILIQFPIKQHTSANIAIGSLLYEQNRFSREKYKELTHVVNAFQKEGLPDSAVYAAIQFLQNTLDVEEKDKSSTPHWQNTIRISLVTFFLMLSILIFALDSNWPQPATEFK